MSDAADIEAQAAAWIARCDAHDGDQDAEFAAWLIADPRHRAAFVRLSRAWERTRCLSRLRPDDGSIDPDLLAPARPPDLWRRFRRRADRTEDKASDSAGVRRAPALRPRPERSPMAMAGIAAALMVVTWNLLPWSSTQSYHTGRDGLSRVVLSDGSAVTMNANTALRVHFTAARRGVTLIRGEAHFSVTHDTHRPFEVHARDRVVVAVGTAFDVRLASGNDVEVTVTEGRVALLGDGDTHPSAGSLALQTISAGQSALLTTSAVAVRRIESSEIFRRLAWERRELSFDGQTLRQAVAEFGRYTNRKITIDDASIASLEIGGSFRALDIDSFIAALGHSFGVSSRVSGDGAVHLYRASERNESM